MNKINIAVIGSGPGGALTAALLAEHGREVLLIEKGKHWGLNSCSSFSQEEMIQKYRNGGLTLTFGDTKISYIEGSCVGGGSEINSGLYFRTPETILSHWRKKYKVDDLDENILQPHFEANERDLSVSFMPSDQIPAASLKLHQGAQTLGWKSIEVPRWYKYQQNGEGIKQSMTETLIPRAIAAGAIVQSETMVEKIYKTNNIWIIKGNAQGKAFHLAANKVFLCAGAISTPQLLSQNGLSMLAGKTLHMHPTIKIVGKFNEKVNNRNMGVPVHQVKEFSPRFGFGCSVSSYPYLALAMMDIPHGLHKVNAHWENMAIYYSMVTSGKGSVSHTFLGKDPLVKYTLGQQGFVDTLDGMEKLGECLFAAGAEEIYPSVANSRTIHNLSELKAFKSELMASSFSRLNMMTIHLFSSCPMGEDRSQCVVNSFGQVHGQENLYVNDASMLCGPLGVNPQGTIMAIARRNISQFLKK